jgi:hypothetical protein
MTLDEAIKHCEELVEAHDKLRKSYDDASGYSRSHNEAIRTDDAKKHEKCSQDFRQLVEWIKELKAYKEQEPCADAISRKAAIVQLYHNKTGDDDVDVIIERDIATIHKLPSVTSKRKTGEWIKHDTGHSIYYDCSLCGCAAPCTETADKILWKLSNYCPDCGTKMENLQKSEDAGGLRLRWQKEKAKWDAERIGEE